MSENRDTRGLSGLSNLGNTCYMNSTLQCLFATDVLNSYLKSKRFKYDLKHGIVNIEVDKYKYLLKSNQHISLDDLTRFIKTKKVLLKDNFSKLTNS